MIYKNQCCNVDCRHHIPKMSFQVQNWQEYEVGLRRRGSLTLWVEEDALDQWQSVGQNGTSTNRRLDRFSADIDEPDDLGIGIAVLNECSQPGTQISSAANAKLHNRSG